MTNINLLPKDLRQKKHYRSGMTPEVIELEEDQAKEEIVAEPIISETTPIPEPPIQIFEKTHPAVQKKPSKSFSLPIKRAEKKDGHGIPVFSSFSIFFSQKQKKQPKRLNKKIEFKATTEKKLTFTKPKDFILTRPRLRFKWNKIKGWLTEDIRIKKTIYHKKHINFIHSLHDKNSNARFTSTNAIKPLPVRDIRRAPNKENIRVVKELFARFVKQPFTRKIIRFFLSDITPKTIFWLRATRR